MGEGLSVPCAIRLDSEQVENALETSLEDVDGLLVLDVLLLLLLGVFLCLLNVGHDLLKLLPASLELALGGVTDAVVLVALDLIVDVLDLF